LTALISALPDPVMLLDSHGLVRTANAKARDLLNMDPEGQHISSAIRAPAILEAVQAVLELQQDVIACGPGLGRGPVIGEERGFAAVFSGPFVRSSYMADLVAHESKRA